MHVFANKCVMTCPNYVDIPHSGDHTPHGFVLPPKHTSMRENISTHSREVTPYKHIPCASLCDVRFHGLQYPPFVSLQSTSFMSTCILACGANISV